jgi:hypothetical protein
MWIFKDINCPIFQSMKRVIINLLVFFLTGQLFVNAQQQLPVRTITNISTPYPVSLEQFIAIENSKLSLTIIPNDVKLVNYPIKLKLVISGGWFTISTNPSFIHPNITLSNGEIQTFSGAELAEWFNPDNLIFEGYSKSQYIKNGRLPEGMYQVWFEVYESNYGYNMSSSTKAIIWMFENDPPLLNFPDNAKEFAAIDPQNIVFNWTLRQAPFSVAGASNEYKFELWEIWPDNMNIEEVIRTTRPVYSGTTNVNTFTYSAAEPLLLQGRKYAWRIQVYDPEGKKQYKNDGYSEVRWFRFGKDCGVPSPVTDKVSDNAIALKWENDYRFDKYEIRWRFKDRQDAKWYTVDGERQGVLISKLEPNTQYEIQAHGYCGIQEGEYSPSLTIRTKEETSCACGTPVGNIDLSAQEPLPMLKSGDFFRASDFEVQVYQVTGSNGTFSGKGFVSVPLLKSIKFEAEFKSVKINKDYRMYNGDVSFIYNPKNGISINISNILTALSNNKTEVNEANPYTDIADRKAKIDTTITTITVRSNGEIVVTKADGRKEVIRATTGEMVAISGKAESSEQYVIDTKTGTLYKATPDKGSNGNKQPSSGNGPVKYNVTFEPHSNQIYGMDIPGENTPVAVYNKTNIAGNEKDIAWKSVETGKIDRLLAKVEGGSVDSLHYLTASDNMVMVAPGTEKNTSQLLVTGVEKTDELKAWYPEKVNDSTENRILAAQLNLVAYDKQLVNISLVEVNGAVAPNADFVEKELNEIYASAVVQWKVKKIEGFKVNIEGLDNGKFVNKRTDGKMDYTDNEKQVRDAFIITKDYDKSTVYLFFIGGNTTQDLKGFMPFNRQFGFIFTEYTNASDVIRTIAHEAGHGTFRLKHPYEATDPRMNTDNNLMAYSQSNRLYKAQWDECHDKDLGVNWFEDGEDGEAAGFTYKFFFLTQDSHLKYLSEKGRRQSCGDYVGFETMSDEFNPNLNYSFSKVDSATCKGYKMSVSNSADIYINNVLIDKQITLDTSILSIKRKYLPKLSRGSNPFKIVMNQKNGTKWIAMDTMQLNFVIKDPKYFIYTKDSITSRNQILDTCKVYPLKINAPTTIAVYDKFERDSIQVKSIKWEIKFGNYVRHVNNKDTIKITATDLKTIKVKAFLTYKNGIDTINFKLTATEVPVIPVIPIAFTLAPVSANDKMVYTNSAGKGQVALKNSGNSVNVKFVRKNRGDDFTLLTPKVTNTEKLRVTLLGRTASDISIRIESIPLSEKIDSSYVNLVDTAGKIRATQVVYILKPFNMDVNFWHSPSVGMASYNVGANAFLDYIYGSLTSKITQAIAIEPDKNHNGWIDWVNGDPAKDEFSLVTANKIANQLNVYFVPGKLVECWKIDSLLPDRKTATLATLIRLGSSITCDVLDSSMVVLNTGVTATKTATGVTFSNRVNAHARYIRDNSSMAGIKIGEYQVIVGVRASSTEETLVHELLHTRGLFDINVPGNMMHWTSIPIVSPYFSNEKVPECNTGTGTAIPAAKTQRQWFDVAR